MTTPWLVKYNVFIKQKQTQKARNILIVESLKNPYQPMIYLLSFPLFCSTREWKILHKIFYQALFLFPDSLFIKEVLLFVSVKYFSRSKTTAWIISEYIIPTIKVKEEHNYTKLYYWLSQYFSKRTVLDSALLYAQMGRVYNSSYVHQYTFFLQEVYIILMFKNIYALKQILQEEYPLWANHQYSLQWLEYLIPYTIFVPTRGSKENIEKVYRFFNNGEKNSIVPKKNIKSKKYYQWIIILILLLSFIIAFLLK